MKKLDLHGISHLEASNVVARFINDYWESGRDVEVITGHSSRMKQIVVDQCYDYKVRYYCAVHSPVIKIYLSEVV